MKERCRRKKRLMAVGLLLMSLSFVFKSVEASSESDLPSGIIAGDDKGIKIKNDGDYLIDIQDVAPGRKWSTKITITNIEKKIPYHLTMHVSEATINDGPLDLSQAIQMTLIYDGKEVYKGPLSGVSKAMNLQDKSAPLNLGVFKGGDTRMLEAQFELDGKTYTNEDFLKKNSAYNTWHFKAIRAILPDTAGLDQQEKPFLENLKSKLRLPRTGEEWGEALLFSCVGLFLVLVSLLIFKHKKLEGKSK